MSLLPQLNRIQAHHAAGAAPPVALREIDINVTNFCNIECIYCSYSSRPDRKEPSLHREAALSLLEQAHRLGVEVIHFSGGEPVTWPHILEAIRRGAELGFRMRMHSNGALLKPETLRKLWNAGLRRVLVSLDGPPEDHDFHRGRRGLYELTLAAVENASAMGFDVRVNAVATSLNVDHLAALVPLVCALGAATYSIFYLIPVGRGRDLAHLMVPPRRWRRFLEELRQAAASSGASRTEITAEKVFFWDDDPAPEPVEEGGRGHGCLGFLKKCDYVNVLADGRVYPCVCFADVGPPLGNIHRRPLADLLADPEAWAFYRSLAAPADACRGCPRLAECGGGSKALSRTLTGDWFRLDPRCSGDPRAQRFYPLCFMLRENITTRSRRGFAEHFS
jgi:radical SAM protein with 4Fe4S-binding SPASM domain